RWLGAGVCLAGFVAGQIIDYRFADAMIGLGFISFLAHFPAGERGLNARVDHTLASGSYSMYVIHLPLVAFVCLLFNQAGFLPVGGVPLSLLLAGMIGVAATVVGSVCVLYYWLFERNTGALRRGLLEPR